MSFKGLYYIREYVRIPDKRFADLSFHVIIIRRYWLMCDSSVQVSNEYVFFRAASRLNTRFDLCVAAVNGWARVSVRAVIQPFSLRYLLPLLLSFLLLTSPTPRSFLYIFTLWIYFSQWFWPLISNDVPLSAWHLQDVRHNQHTRSLFIDKNTFSFLFPIFRHDKYNYTDRFQVKTICFRTEFNKTLSEESERNECLLSLPPSQSSWSFRSLTASPPIGNPPPPRRSARFALLPTAAHRNSPAWPRHQSFSRVSFRCNRALVE